MDCKFFSSETFLNSMRSGVVLLCVVAVISCIPSFPSAQDLRVSAAHQGSAPAPQEEALRAVPEAIIGSRARWEPLTALPRNDKVWRYAHSVGRLTLSYANAPDQYCTGFLVDQDKILTNQHCITSEGGARKIVVEFGVFGMLNDQVKELGVSPVPISQSTLLDYALLELSGKSSLRRRALELASYTPALRTPVFILHHPMGQAMQVSRTKCEVNLGNRSNKRVEHSCDTYIGSSGGPLIDVNGHVVGVHYGKADKTYDIVNLAIIAREIRLAIEQGVNEDRTVFPTLSVAPGMVPAIEESELQSSSGNCRTINGHTTCE